jgi:hypothetical protein
VSSIDSYPRFGTMCSSCKGNVNSRVLGIKISYPFLAKVAILVNTCLENVLLVLYDH